LVQLVRGAMRAADEQGHPCGRNLIVPNREIEPRLRFHPEPVIERRRHIVPEPKIEPRLVRSVDGGYPCPCPPVVVEVAPADAKSSGSPIQPPWKVLPWDAPPAETPRPVHRVKVVIGPPDMCSKGNVIDLFI